MEKLLFPSVACHAADIKYGGFWYVAESKCPSLEECFLTLQQRNPSQEAKAYVSIKDNLGWIEKDNVKVSFRFTIPFDVSNLKFDLV